MWHWRRIAELRKEYRDPGMWIGTISLLIAAYLVGWFGWSWDSMFHTYTYTNACVDTGDRIVCGTVRTWDTYTVWR